MSVPSSRAFRWWDLWTLTVRTIKDADRDRVLGLSAEVAFFALFSLPPTLLAFFGAAGYIGDSLGPGVTNHMIHRVVVVSGAVLTERTVAGVVEPTMRTLLSEGRADVLSIGAIFALWSASRSAHVLLDALSIAYDLKKRRPMWKRRLLAILFTMMGIVTAGIVLPLLVAGPRLGAALAAPLGLAETFALAWNILYWPMIGLISVLVLTLIYHFAIPYKTPFRRDVPGAIFALVLWLLTAVGLREYATWAIEASPLYGSLAAPMVLLLWLYCTALAVLMGAELNSEIEKMWPTITPLEKAAAVKQEQEHSHDDDPPPTLDIRPSQAPDSSPPAL